jgi:hypothetical protein
MEQHLDAAIKRIIRNVDSFFYIDYVYKSILLERLLVIN